VLSPVKLEQALLATLPCRVGGGRLTQNQLKRLRARFDRKRERFIAPSEPTIRRVLQSADVESVERCLSQWLLGIADDHAIAIDGKTLKGAKRDNGTQVHLLSAFLHNQGKNTAYRWHNQYGDRLWNYIINS